MSLQPFEYDPNEKNKHKFMVQSMFAPDGEINQDTLVGSGVMVHGDGVMVHGAKFWIMVQSKFPRAI